MNKTGDTSTIDESETQRRWPSAHDAMPDLSLLCQSARLMLIINCTPDSFSDGGQHQSPAAVLENAERAIEAGVDFFDIGGESTRPGAQSISVQEETDRVLPVIEALHARFDIPISIDSSKAAVADAALNAGAVLVNDVRAGTDPEMFSCVARHQAMMVLMHMQGTPHDMQDAPQYENTIDEISDFFAQRIQAAEQHGIPKEMLILDPGIGFGKSYQHNIEILHNLKIFSRRCDRPLLVGISRKSFLPLMLDATVKTGLGTAADRDDISHHLHALIAHSCSILRVHDVQGARRAISVASAFCMQQDKKQEGLCHV